jgi:L-fuculose-phosphate aldolase
LERHYSTRRAARKTPRARAGGGGNAAGPPARLLVGVAREANVYEEFERIGRDLWRSGSVSSHGGNMSVRDGDRVLITRTGSMLGRLGPRDLIETSLVECGDPVDADCSIELVVHRAIYARTDARAIVHAHTAHTIARSFATDLIVPVDSESMLRFGDAPVVTAGEAVGSAEAGEALARALVDRRIAVLRGHGPFAKGSGLEDAFQAISCLELSCRVLDILDSTGSRARGE